MSVSFSDDIIQILSAIALHYGESLIRTRFTEYAARFVRIAARYEEEYLKTTSIGYPTVPFSVPSGAYPFGRLGSGAPPEAVDEALLISNASRIEGWRHTRSYEYYKMVSINSFIYGCYSSGVGLPIHDGDKSNPRIRPAVPAVTASAREACARPGS